MGNPATAPPSDLTKFADEFRKHQNSAVNVEELGQVLKVSSYLLYSSVKQNHICIQVQENTLINYIKIFLLLYKVSIYPVSSRVTPNFEMIFPQETQTMMLGIRQEIYRDRRLLGFAGLTEIK